ncbi:MAG: hypothetical protein E7384_05650 [Ruminococcaceae bacterium]|nr:hypothetical protein [Oscillospiraceae bacterium]
MNRQLRWMRLDNAAKIYPAAKRRNWSNIFRLSATLTEEVDREVLQRALNKTARRFPSMVVRIRRGMFWYYIEELKEPPVVQDEKSHPLSRMPFDDIRKCAIRVICYKNRIACEFFHAITDGNGGLIFLKSLTAEYLRLKYGENIPCTDGVFDVEEDPDPAELEDSFFKNDGPVKAPRKDDDAFQLEGVKEFDGYNNLITGLIKTDEILKLAKKHGVTLTTFIASVMIASLINIQNRQVPNKRRQKRVKVLIPINLRKMFDSKTVRNFVLYITPGIDTRLGEYSFEEILKSVHHQMGLGITKQNMAAKIAKNVGIEKVFIVKIMPLFIKNFVIKTVYNLNGERKSCITISNLGNVSAPDEWRKYVSRLDFVLGAPSENPNNCGVLSYGENLYINITRTIKDAELEREFFCYLRKLGLNVKIESNRRDR